MKHEVLQSKVIEDSLLGRMELGECGWRGKMKISFFRKMRTVEFVMLCSVDDELTEKNREMLHLFRQKQAEVIEQTEEKLLSVLTEYIENLCDGAFLQEVAKWNRSAKDTDVICVEDIIKTLVMPFSISFSQYSAKKRRQRELSMHFQFKYMNSLGMIEVKIVNEKVADIIFYDQIYLGKDMASVLFDSIRSGLKNSAKEDAIYVYESAKCSKWLNVIGVSRSIAAMYIVVSFFIYAEMIFAEGLSFWLELMENPWRLVPFIAMIALIVYFARLLLRGDAVYFGEKDVIFWGNTVIDYEELRRRITEEKVRIRNGRLEFPVRGSRCGIPIKQMRSWEGFSAFVSERCCVFFPKLTAEEICVMEKTGIGKWLYKCAGNYLALVGVIWSYCILVSEYSLQELFLHGIAWEKLRISCIPIILGALFIIVGLVMQLIAYNQARCKFKDYQDIIRVRF